MNAASDEDLDLMRSLMILGVHVNTCDYDKRTALHIAVSKHLTNLINFLLLNKADPQFKDRWGKPPIEYAQDDNMDEIVKNMEMDNFLFRQAMKKEEASWTESGVITPVTPGSPTLSRSQTLTR